MKRLYTKKSTQAGVARRRAIAAAEPYLMGEKKMISPSPKSWQKYGKYLPRKKAAKIAYNEIMGPHRAMWHTGRPQAFQVRQESTGKPGHGGTWTLRKANVSRSKTTGQFTKRRRGR